MKKSLASELSESLFEFFRFASRDSSTITFHGGDMPSYYPNYNIPKSVINRISQLTNDEIVALKAQTQELAQKLPYPINQQSYKFVIDQCEKEMRLRSKLQASTLEKSC